MKVQLLGEISGTRNGQPWPPRFSVVDLPDDEAVRLCDQRMARPHVEVSESRAVVEPVQDVRGLGGSPAQDMAVDAAVQAGLEAAPTGRRRSRA